jgi:hypothetical protein
MPHAMSPFLRSYTQKLLRPWKLCTLAIGIALLIAGSFYYQAPEWDIPISLTWPRCGC